MEPAFEAKAVPQVYPNLGEQALVYEVATPRTYERFTRRPRGAVGGVRLAPWNANQRAVPHNIGIPGFWLVGDTTWPGLGTVACILGSRIVAEQVVQSACASRKLFLFRIGEKIYERMASPAG